MLNFSKILYYVTEFVHKYISLQYIWSCGVSANIVSDYILDDRVQSPAEPKHFSSILFVQTGSEAHPVSYLIGTGGKARPGRDTITPSSINE
jgi:hypothetical protein